jgi:methylamine dehydrogenase accessory protein MauD
MNVTAIWEILVVVLVLVAVVQAFALLAVMRQVGGLLVRLNPTGVGDVESGPEVDALLEIPGVLPGRPALVVFGSPSCTLCRYLEPAVAAIRANYEEIDVLVVATGGDDAAERAVYAQKFGHSGRGDIPELAKDWNVQGTPFAVGLGADHRVRVRGVANTLDHLESVAETIILPRVEPNEGLENDLDNSALERIPEPAGMVGSDLVKHN